MIKPVIKTGGLVNFKEHIIFENEKNMAFKGIEEFKRIIYKKYKYIATSNLYRKIINYQVKNFGKSLNNEIDLPTHEEKIRLNALANKRRYGRLKGWKCDEK